MLITDRLPREIENYFTGAERSIQKLVVSGWEINKEENYEGARLV